MTKLVLPILLASVVMIAGIFAFMPVYEASTVHTTIQGTQFNNVNSTVQTNTGINATATCDSGSFLVYYTFTNETVRDTVGQTFAPLQIDDSSTGGTDFTVQLALGNTTAVSGVVAGEAGETITLRGEGTSDTGQVQLTVQCRSTATATVSP